MEIHILKCTSKNPVSMDIYSSVFTGALWIAKDPRFRWTEKAYGKCPKISYTKVSDKISYANSVDSGQTEGAV